MKRLFVLRNTLNKTATHTMTGLTMSFSVKEAAKRVRDELNEELERVEWRVSRGPDNLKSSKPHSRG